MSQDILLRRGEGASLSTAEVSAVTLAVAGLLATASVGSATPVRSETARPSGVAAPTALAAPVVRAGISGLQDDFDDESLATSRWQIVDGSGQEVGGYVALTPPTGAAATTSLRTIHRWDLVGNSVAAKVLGIGASDTTRYVALRDAAGNGVAIRLRAASGSLSCGVTQLLSGGALVEAYAQGTSLASATLQAHTSGEAATWVRVRESAGTVACDTAPETADNPPAANQWVTRWSGSLAGVNLANLTYEFHASTEGSAQVAYLDAVNTAAGVATPASVFDVLLRSGTTTTVAAPSFTQASSVPQPTGLAGTSAVGSVTVQVADILARPVGLGATATVETLVATDGVIVPAAVTGTGTAADVTFNPRPAGLAGGTAVGLATVALPDLMVRPAAPAAVGTLGDVAIVRREIIRITGALLLRRQPMGGN